MDVYWRCPECGCETEVEDDYEYCAQVCDECETECVVKLNIKVESVKVIKGDGSE